MVTLTPEEPAKPTSINWTGEKLERLKVLYKRAELSNQDCVIVEGQLILTGYAKYLIEFLETEFKATK